MFNLLRNLFESEDTLAQPYKDLTAMLEQNYELHKVVVRFLKGETSAQDIEEDIYSRDVDINKQERHIRKEIVTHVSINPEQDAVGCLVLMSLVKDAERMGDHAKNLYEAICGAGVPGPQLRYIEQILGFEKYIEDTYKKTIESIRNENVELAEDIVRSEVDKNKEFDNFITEISDSDLSAKEAVATTLISRALKRIQSHLSNIASSMVQPVDLLDHRPKDMRPSSDNS